MSDRDVVRLFNDLKSRYPMAAAGLIEQLCADLSKLLESNDCDSHRVASACREIAQCFRPIDRVALPQSYPWDAAYDIFGRWLMRGLPQYKEALLEITGWSEDQVTKCKTRYIDMVRANRDDWNRAAQQLETDIIG